jgi:uncharacterized surface protein with fasciclin (FAS1) repeats
MKRFEINAYSLEEAKAKAAEMGLVVVRNVTMSWKNAGSPVTDKAFKEFAVEALDKNHLTNANGVGLMVVVAAGSADTRERPYKYTNNVVEGKKNIERVYEIRRKADDVVVGVAAKKADAEKLAKKLMAEEKTDLECTIVYHVTEGKDLAFTLEYVPSVNTKAGSYIVFGNVSEF